MFGFFDDFEDALMLVGILGLTAVGCAAATASRDVRVEEIRKGYPAEYWSAQEAEAQERIKRCELEAEERIRKHEIEVAAQERLKLDARERDAVARRERLEFEKGAPAEYWTYRREHERMEAEKKIAQERSKADIEAAKQRAKALENSARNLAHAFEN